jgi:3D (Asp-Asp-Asp) domain-containing protein
MKTNKHTKRRLNPGFVILVVNVALILSLVVTLSYMNTLRRNLSESYQQAEELRTALVTANKAEENAVQALQDFKAEYYQVQEDNLSIPGSILEPITKTNTVSKVLTVKVTAYCSCVKCCGVWSKDHPSRQGTDYEQHTTSGTIPVAGRTVAVDPDIIPLGSKILIDGHEYIAEDTGSGVKGNHIDIYFDSHEEALEWGVKTLEVEVFEDEIL